MESMTGFGRSEGLVGNQHFTVEMKSVNHRFFDARIRLPQALSLYENIFYDLVKKHFERGSFEIGVKQRLAPEQGKVVTGVRYALDEMAAKSLLSAVTQAKSVLGLNTDVSVEKLVEIKSIIVPIDEVESTDSIVEPLKGIFKVAAQQLKVMRMTEGKKLAEALELGLTQLTQCVCQLEKIAPEHPKRILEKLSQRIQNWQLSSPVSQERLEWEVAFYAEKADVSEELVRLRAHIQSFQELLKGPAAVGRRLDFLSQELNREANTLSSKASNLEMTQIAVEVKTIIEKLREQVQNVE